MSVPFLDLGRRLREVRPDVEAAMANVLDSGRLIGGPVVEAFELEFAQMSGASHAVGVASGTDAITIALLAAGVGPGDEVVTVANTCVPTVAGIEATGARVVLADADPTTWTVSPGAVAEAVTPRTRAIVPVHLYGRRADIDALAAIARDHDLRIVEDAAQGHGLPVYDTAAFSFYPTKNLGGVGDGGAVVTHDRALADRARMLRTYGERERFTSEQRGRNSRLDPIQAAALQATLPRLVAWNARRRQLAATYVSELGDLELGLPTVDGAEHVFHLFVVLSPARKELRRTLAELGVETAVHYPRAIHEHPAYRELGGNRRLDVSERLARDVVSLPLYPELRDREQEQVIAALRRTVQPARPAARA